MFYVAFELRFCHNSQSFDIVGKWCGCNCSLLKREVAATVVVAEPFWKPYWLLAHPFWHFMVVFLRDVNV